MDYLLLFLPLYCRIYSTKNLQYSKDIYVVKIRNSLKVSSVKNPIGVLK